MHFNCGVTSTGSGELARDRTLKLDGGESTITQANGSEFSAHAKWDGNTVTVTRDTSPYASVTQTLSIENGKLTVVTMFSLADAATTLTYVKR